MGKDNRILEIDLCRTLCVFWIVAVWHMYKMIPENFLPSEDNSQRLSCITGIVLSCFTFLSGYFLKKYEFKQPKDVWIFYRKRLTRFYLLFIIASLGVFVTHYKVSSHISLYLSTILGYSLISPPTMRTMWYFSMLMLFYFVTPMVIWRNNKFWKLALSSLIFTIFIILVRHCHSDIRLINYFPFYILGLCLPEKMFSFIKTNIIAIIAIIVSIIMIYFFADMYEESYLIRLPINLLGVAALIGFSFMLYNHRMKKLVIIGGYSSMCVYLFHRIFLACGVKFLGEERYNGHLGVYTAFLLVIIYFISGYYIQRLYDYCLNRWTRK